jgi:hypothetical protein
MRELLTSIVDILSTAALGSSVAGVPECIVGVLLVGVRDLLVFFAVDIVGVDAGGVVDSIVDGAGSIGAGREEVAVTELEDADSVWGLVVTAGIGAAVEVVAARVAIAERVLAV